MLLVEGFKEFCYKYPRQISREKLAGRKLSEQSAALADMHYINPNLDNVRPLYLKSVEIFNDMQEN